jgi:hypothetical protein
VVKIPTAGAAPTPNRGSLVLRGILKRANYSTPDMRASEGQIGPEEVTIIRRILAGSVTSNNYPHTVRRRKREDVAALASWENEGGAVKLP